MVFVIVFAVYFSNHPSQENFNPIDIAPQDHVDIQPIQDYTPISLIQIQQQNCDSSYPDFCIPPYTPDLDCVDILQSNFRVNFPDKHRLMETKMELVVNPKFLD